MYFTNGILIRDRDREAGLSRSWYLRTVEHDSVNLVTSIYGKAFTQFFSPTRSQGGFVPHFL